MKAIALPSGQSIPVLGMGTWQMGERSRDRQTEINALKHGIELGITLIDTAEMYGEGSAEEVIAEAFTSWSKANAGRREQVFLVSKVYPHNASRQGTIAACERSLRRLKTDYLDLYLLHWRGSVPLFETLAALQTLQQAGKIRDYGVSNFDLSDMQEARSLPGGESIATNQVLYNLMRRGIEWDLLPWCQQHGVPIMAYSPVEQGRLLKNRQLAAIAERLGVTSAQVAIAWLLHQDNVIVIPKASDLAHVEQNRAALDLRLSAADLHELDALFPPPSRPVALEML
ncbi:aldo/keto reductase [Leptolyngbya sp. ST-U4]|uniref:aldo/keto reductase n=1 Tax=Leptolyngbya sp. ST-U4 TaxID=2933912 RepID=UPI0019BB6587|nr:aldo/keto reductase [Cyanobacteria bacterium FACHB-502]